MKKVLFIFFLSLFSNSVFSQKTEKVFSFFFDSNSSKIILDSINQNALDSIKFIYKKYKKPISIQGYANELGSDDFNYKLSMDRANAVKDLLKANRVLKFNLIKANGEIKGLKNIQKKNNRRVDLFISKDNIIPSKFKEGNKIVLLDLFDDTRRANLDHFFIYASGNSKREFQNLINSLKKYAFIKFEILTYYSPKLNHPDYTETQKTLNYNYESKKNDFAEAKGIFLKDFFVKEGISSSRISLKSCKFKEGYGTNYGQHVELLILENK